MPVRATMTPEDNDGAGHAGAASLHCAENAFNTQRLWRPFSYRPKRPRELKDLDRYNETMIGAAQRLFRAHRRLRACAQRVVELSDSMMRLAEVAFDEQIDQARQAARRGRRDHESRAHAFAVVREAVRRTLGFRLFVEQVMGAWVMEDG